MSRRGAHYRSFVYRLDDGRFVGPFGIQLHTPEIGQHFMGLAQAMAKILGLQSSTREIAILVVGAHTKAAYEEAAHQQLSGFSKSELEDIEKRVCPAHFDEEKKAVFAYATELVEKPGPLSQETWQRTVNGIGVQGTTAVVHYVGFYKYVATILNGFNVQVPELPERFKI